MPSRAVKLCGTDKVDPPTRVLRAGPLSAAFDNGALRTIRLGDTEVIRAIAFLVRDENWGTFTPALEDVAVDERPDRFTVRYRATCADAQRTLAYEARITGTSAGTLDFEVTAEPRTDVLTNRTGFIVLHPLEGVAGRPVRVLHTDGRTQTSAFPAEIDPRCPFTDIRALSHEVAPGTWVTCTMEGDAFEMEDQRNWSDASYKTYVRPLKRPWPYTLPKGERLAQAVRLSVEGPLPTVAASGEGRAVTVRLGADRGRTPEIGVGVPAEEAGPALDRAALVRRLAPRFLVCGVDLRQGHGRRELEAHKALADAVGADVALEIITRGTLDPNGELRPLADAAAALGLEPASVAVFPAQDMVSVQPDAPWPEMPTFAETYAAARAAFPRARPGGGMATYFTELNRKRPPAALLDFVTYTTCPIVHAADDVSVMETLEALPPIVRSTRAFMGEGVPQRIGPSQIACRENPYGKGTAPNTENGRVCLSRLDPRQRGLFNAAWTLGYVAALAANGVEAVALGAPTGPFGLIHGPADGPQPWWDDQPGETVYPAFHVMAELARLSGAVLVEVGAPARGIAALAARRDGRTTMLLANLTDTPIPVAVTGAARVAVLDADSFEAAARTPGYLETALRDAGAAPLVLDAYAVARVDLG